MKHPEFKSEAWKKICHRCYKRPPLPSVVRLRKHYICSACNRQRPANKRVTVKYRSTLRFWENEKWRHKRQYVYKKLRETKL